MEPIIEEQYDMRTLSKELDKVKSRVFMGKNAAFLGSLMCSLEFMWTKSIETAGTNGSWFYWNPEWFMKLPPDTRETVLLHELWHVARLHPIRCDNRVPLIWNFACDIRINNDLENEGSTFAGTEPWLDQKYGLQPEEDIYDDLIKNAVQVPAGMWGEDGDIIPVNGDDKVSLINNVVSAIHQAKLAGEAGNLPGDIEALVDKFLSPILDWNILLHRFFTDLLQMKYTWRRPRRRLSSQIYLPSRFQDKGRLTHLVFFIDVSGSISDAQLVRFFSEIKYIKDKFKPEKLTVIQFDKILSKEIILTEKEEFERIQVLGRGGTSLIPVRNWINENKPTAAVILTDLFVPPMEPLIEPIPIQWVVSGNPSAQVPFGNIIHIPEMV